MLTGTVCNWSIVSSSQWLLLKIHVSRRMNLTKKLRPHAHLLFIDHDHEMEEVDEIPAWKKRALESGNDPNAAPFGGSWNTESSLDATK